MRENAFEPACSPFFCASLSRPTAFDLCGRTAVLATLHGKARAIAPPLRRRLGIEVEKLTIVDTDSPMGRAMFTIIGAMAKLESSLISERVTERVINEIEALATSTDLSICAIQKKIAGRASRGIIGEVTKRTRATLSRRCNHFLYLSSTYPD